MTEPPGAPAATSAPPTLDGSGRGGSSPLLVPLLAGLAVAVVLGVYGRLHEPPGVAISIAGFSGPGYVKSWLATLAVVLAVVQLATALDMWGRFGRRAPSWVGPVHRWSGRVAVIATVPVVVHCLYAFGFEYDSPRVLVHSLVGCLFYGAFVAKMLSLTRRGVPGWALPVLGGAVFTGLVVIWLTSAVWLFTTKGLHF